MITADVNIVIVTYNSAEVIRACLESLQFASVASSRYRVTVIDNMSSDATVSIVKTSFPFVSVIDNGTNAGFARAVNAAVLGSAWSDFVLLVNPDAMVKKSDADSLISFLESHADVGVVGPGISHPEGRSRVQTAGRFPTVWRMFTHYFGLSRAFAGSALFQGHYELMASQPPEAVEVDWVTGACLAANGHVWHELNGLSERWFMYAEDIEFCWRVKQSGRKVFLLPQTIVSHSIGGSSTGHEMSFNPAWVINLYDFYKTDISTFQLAPTLWRLVVSAGLQSRSFAYLILSGSPTRENKFPWHTESKRFAAYARAVRGARQLGKSKH